MIDYSLIFPLILFALVSTGTPGPNNIMLLTSGANFGYMRTVPHMMGIWAGLGSMMIVMSMGLSQIFDVYPLAKTVLKVLATAYMLWLAWKIINTVPADQAEAIGQPMTPLQAALFQLVNPKAWAMTISAVTLYAVGTGWFAVAILVAIFIAVSFFTNSTWILLGQQVTRFLSTPARLRSFNFGMAIVLILSLYPILT